MRPSTLTLFVCALAGLALASLGCPPSDYGKKCRFTGDDLTECGTCIATSCQGYVDSCCASTYSCAAELGTLDECASTGACTKLAAKAATTSSASSEMRAIAQCAQASCAAACGGLGSSGVSTRPSSGTLVPVCTSSTRYCSCVLQDIQLASVAEVCSVDTARGASSLPAICCADVEWPSSGTCACSASSSRPTCPSGTRELNRCG